MHERAHIHLQSRCAYVRVCMCVVCACACVCVCVCVRVRACVHACVGTCKHTCMLMHNLDRLILFMLMVRPKLSNKYSELEICEFMLFYIR